MLNIKEYLKNLSAYTKINFAGKEAEMAPLANKYDKNKNSIFESDELQAIQDDLRKYAGSDEKTDDLSEDEAGNFLKAILPEETSLADFLQRAEKQAEGFVKNLFDNLNRTGIDNDKDGFIKNKIKELEGKREFDEDFIEQLSMLNAEQLEKAAQVLFIEQRKNQFYDFDVLALADLDDVQFECAKTLFNTTYGDENKEFKGWEIAKLAKLKNIEIEKTINLCNTKEILDRFEYVTEIIPLARLTDEQFERAETLFYVENRGKNQFDGSGIAELAKLKDEQFERAKTLFNVEDCRKRQFDGYEIAELAKLKDEQFERAKMLFSLEKNEYENKFNGYEIVELAGLKSKQFERAKTLFNTTYGDENKEFDGYKIATLAQLTDKQLERAISLLNTKDIFERFESVYNITELAKLTDSQLERAKTLFDLKIRDKKLSSFEISQLAKLSESQLERAKALINTADETNQYNCIDISMISKLTKDEYERAQNFMNIENREEAFSGAEISMLAKMLSDDQIERAKEFLFVENREEQFNSNEIVTLSLLNDEQLELAKSLLFIQGRQEQLYAGEIYIIASLSEKDFERIKDLIYIENRGENQLHGTEIAELAKLSDDELEQAKELVYIESRGDNQFNGTEITALARLPKKDLKRAKTLINNPNERINGIDIANMIKFSLREYKHAKELFYVESRGENQFSGTDIVALAKLSKEKFERAKTLFNVESRGERQLCGTDIAQLAKLPKDKFAHVKDLLYVESRDEKQFDGMEIASLAKLSEKEFERAKTLFNVDSRGDKQFYGAEIVELSKLSKEEFERAESLFYVDNREQQFAGYEIAALSKLSKEEFEHAKRLFNLPDRLLQLSANDIVELVKLPEDKYAQAEKLLYLEERELNYGKDIATLAALTDDEISNVSDYMSDWYFNSYNLVLMAQNNCEELNQYLNENPNPEIVYTAGNSIKFKNENMFYTYDKTGLIETGEEQKVPDSENIKNGTLTTYMNTKLNVKHEILEGEIPNKNDIKTVFEETLTFFDNDGNVIRTVTMKRNPTNGTLNVSETGKDGNQIPIQWESIDPYTGANITERHLISPEGVRTDFFCEESDKLKITDYVITDKDGKNLINVHQTFEQKSDNIFISSINTTGKPEDTQIYKIIYTKDGKIKILDKNNKKTTVIDLKKYIPDEKSLEKLLPTIKQLPAQVLLEFEEKPLTMGYMENIQHNAFWMSLSNTLILGNFDNTTDKENTLLAVITHELGHYLDLYNKDISKNTNYINSYDTEESKFADNPEIIAIYKEEFNAFIEKTTSAQQQYIDYFTDPNWIGQSKERIAETHSLLYSKEGSMINTRRLYLAEYFPRTVAAIMKLLLEEEGVNVT